MKDVTPEVLDEFFYFTAYRSPDGYVGVLAHGTRRWDSVSLPQGSEKRDFRVRVDEVLA